MCKIFRNMIPYWKSVVIIVLLLCVQAYCDLALPNYTSRIIDVGIQDRGVEHVAPEAITEESYAKAQTFMNSDDIKLWKSIYDKDGSVYRLNVSDEEELDRIDDELLIPVVADYQMNKAMEQAETDPAAAEAAGGEAPDSGMPTDTAMAEYSIEDMEKMAESIGTETLMSMGVAFASECSEEAGIDMDAVQKDYLWSSGRKMLGIAFIMLAASIMVAFFAARVGAGIGRNLRNKVFRNVVSFSNGEMDKFSTASLITRNTNDVQQIQMVSSMLLRMVLYAPIIAIGGVYNVWKTGAGMGWVIGLAVIVIIGFVMLLAAVAMPKFKIMQTMVDGLNLVSREILTGLPVIRAFGREEAEEERFDKANRKLMGTQLFTNRVMTLMMPGMTLIMNCLVVLITWVSAHRIDDGTLQVGTMTAFITYSMLIVMSFLMLTMMSIMLPRAGVAADRIEEVIRTTSSVTDAAETVKLEDAKGVVEFRNVSFRYPDANENVINNISFTAEPGKVTAIIGSTGSGKSTLVNLLPRFYDVTEGSITVDGVDVRDLSLQQLRELIGFVPQKGVLFSGTIASNLRFGREDASDEEIALAAEIAQAEEFIDTKPKKYDDYISQGGANVSGGQKQRLAIARAIAKNPKIFVFDDSFSALDMKTDAKLRKALSRHVENSTEIIVAQRISTILHADQIIVLDNGEVAGMGTHSELMNSCQVYREIAESQLSQKEIAKMLGEVNE
ncbi:MAG: ABC transporter ATP-binding protein/permease [Firmicutes bacterium]|nr:ABC transporter ATP-binding protein/permease [Bacillota bacterium]